MVLGAITLNFALLAAGLGVPAAGGGPDCATLSACLAWFDARVPQRDDGSLGALCPQAAKAFTALGEPAKFQLLARLSDPNPGWRNLAGCALQHFPGLVPGDVPQLARALRDHHGGWVANALGEIGTDEAIGALIEDLPNGAASQTGGALTKLGARAVPYLFDMVVNEPPDDYRASSAALSVLGDIGDAATAFAPEWQRIALSETEPVNRRVAALNVLRALGPSVSALGPALRPLLTAAEPQLSCGAQYALLSMRDPSAIAGLLKFCPPTIDPLADGMDGRCLLEIARFGPVANSAGPDLLKHLRSQGWYDRVYAAVTLGMIGYQPAIPDLVAALDGPDWRLTLAAARSLGWLHAAPARAALARVASEHWLDAVRAEAAMVVGAIDADTFDAAPSGDFRPLDGSSPFDFDQMLDSQTSICEREQGMMTGSAEDLPVIEGVDGLADALAVDGGSLLGTNRGEFGGELWFRSAKGDLSKIYPDNVTGIARTPDGIVAVTGLAHMSFNQGYVLLVTQGPNGIWHAQRKLALPGAPAGVEPTDAGSLLIRTVSGNVVLHPGWQLEQVACELPEAP